MEHYQDGKFMLYIAKHGVRAGDPDNRPSPYNVPNAPHCESNSSFADYLQKSIAEEVSMNRTWAKPDELETSLWKHALFVKDECKIEIGIYKWRDIHDLSKPRGASLNDTIYYASQTWVRHEDVLRRIKRNSVFAKTDLKRMYRMFVVDPEDWALLAFIHQGQEYWDCALEWGMRNAVEIAHRTCTAIIYMMNRRGVYDVFGVIDDILLLSTAEEIDEMRANGVPTPYDRLCAVLDVTFGPNARHTKPEKCQDFEPLVVHCGNEFTGKGSRTDPAFAQRLMSQALKLGTSASGESAAEHLNCIGRCIHAACNVWCLRAYLNPGFAVSDTLNNWPPNKPYKSNATLRDMYKMAYYILSITLGLRLPAGNPTPTAWAETDARGLAEATDEPAAIGIFINCTMFRRFTSSELLLLFDDAPALDADIAVFELYAVLVALRIYPDYFRGKTLGFLIDNPAASAVLKKARAQSKDGPLKQQMHDLNIAILTQLTRLDARITEVALVPGEQNPRADAVSRGDWVRLQALLQ
jgi:hypothetical protein